MGSHPKLFLRFGLNLKLLWPGQIIEQQASSLFLDYYKNGNFVVVVACACLLSIKTVSLALSGNSICCLSSNHRVHCFFPFFVACTCCCCLCFWLHGLAQHSLYEGLACSPCRHWGLKPLSLRSGRLFLLMQLLLPQPPLSWSLCCLHRSC